MVEQLIAMLHKTVSNTNAEIDIVGLGTCEAVRMRLDGGVGYRWRIRWRNITVLGDCRTDNQKALQNAINKLTKRLNITK